MMPLASISVAPFGHRVTPLTATTPEFLDGRHLTLCGICKRQSLGMMTLDDLETVDPLASHRVIMTGCRPKWLNSWDLATNDFQLLM